jgi:hypothetical protein
LTRKPQPSTSQRQYIASVGGCNARPSFDFSSSDAIISTLKDQALMIPPLLPSTFVLALDAKFATRYLAFPEDVSFGSWSSCRFL